MSIETNPKAMDVRKIQRVSKKVDRYSLSTNSGKDYVHPFNKHSRSGYRKALDELAYNARKGFADPIPWFQVWDSARNTTEAFFAWDGSGYVEVDQPPRTPIDAQRLISDIGKNIL